MSEPPLPIRLNQMLPETKHHKGRVRDWARAVKHGGHNTNELLKSFNLVATAMVIIS